MNVRLQLNVKRTILLLAVFLLLPVSPSLAALMENFANGAVGISLANTCTAYPPGITSVHYNPAGLSNLREGKLMSFGLIGADMAVSSRMYADPNFDGFFGINDDPLAGTGGTSEGVFAYSPVTGPLYLPVPIGGGPIPLGVSYRGPDSRWTFAFSVYTPFVGGYFRGPDDPARFSGAAVSQQHIIYAAPAFSYQLTDTLSVGATFGMGAGAYVIRMDMRAPSDFVALTRVLGEATEDLEIPILSELTVPPPFFGGGIGPYDTLAAVDVQASDNYTPNYNLGLLWQPSGWFSFGACYQSAIKPDMSGTYELRYSQEMQNTIDWMGATPLLQAMAQIFDLPYQAVAGQKGTLVLEGANTPPAVHMGVMFRPVRRLRLMVDTHWMQWSSFSNITLKFDQDLDPFRVAKFLGHTEGPRQYSINLRNTDEFHFSYAVEFEALEWLTLRAGYEDRKRSTNPQYFSLLAPVPDLQFIGAGCGIKLKNGVDIDLAGAYVFSKTWYVPNGTSKVMNSTNFLDSMLSPYAGLDVEGEFEAMFVSANFTMSFEVAGDLFNHQVELIESLVNRLISPSD